VLVIFLNMYRVILGVYEACSSVCRVFEGVSRIL